MGKARFCVPPFRVAFFCSIGRGHGFSAPPEKRSLKVEWTMEEDYIPEIGVKDDKNFVEICEELLGGTKAGCRTRWISLEIFFLGIAVCFYALANLDLIHGFSFCHMPIYFN